jgi:DNA-binding transcriptional ArsR family regulator
MYRAIVIDVHRYEGAVRDGDPHRGRAGHRDGGVLRLGLGVAVGCRGRGDRAAVQGPGRPHRVKILNLLVTSPEPVCVCEFTGLLGLSQPTVSHHLKKLAQAGLVDGEQRGIWAYYSLRRDALGGLTAALDLQGANR